MLNSEWHEVALLKGTILVSVKQSNLPKVALIRVTVLIQNLAVFTNLMRELAFL